VSRGGDTPSPFFTHLGISVRSGDATDLTDGSYLPMLQAQTVVVSQPLRRRYCVTIACCHDNSMHLASVVIARLTVS